MAISRGHVGWAKARPLHWNGDTLGAVPITFTEDIHAVWGNQFHDGFGNVRQPAQRWARCALPILRGGTWRPTAISRGHVGWAKARPSHWGDDTLGAVPITCNEDIHAVWGNQFHDGFGNVWQPAQRWARSALPILRGDIWRSMAINGDKPRTCRMGKGNPAPLELRHPRRRAHHEQR